MIKNTCMHIIIYIVNIYNYIYIYIICTFSSLHDVHAGAYATLYIYIYIVNLQCMPAHLGMNPVFEVSERNAKTVNCFAAFGLIYRTGCGFIKQLSPSPICFLVGPANQAGRPLGLPFFQKSSFGVPWRCGFGRPTFVCSAFPGTMK